MRTDASERPHVLVVEDEWIIAYELEAMLDSMGCGVIGPASGVAQALDLIAAQSPVAALLDVSLGGENSFPIAEELNRRGIPFAFTTGYLEGDLPPHYDACMLLNKPVPELTLRTAVTALLNGHAQTAAASV